MAKSNATYPKTRKKLTLVDILKGNFLNRDEVKAHYKYFLLIFILIMIIIYSNHLVNQKIGRINELKNQVEEYKSQNAYAQSKLIKIKLESELSKEVEKDSLMALETHPLKIFVKLDSTTRHGKTNEPKLCGGVISSLLWRWLLLWFLLEELRSCRTILM